MFDGYPISGLALCYGPLFLTIAGFIAYAVITDAHARRTYLRNTDTRDEFEKEHDTPIEVERKTTTETPAGMSVTILPEKK